MKTRDHSKVSDRIEGEAPSEPDGCDQRGGQRRARDLRQRDDRAVEHDGVRQIVLGDHLRDERSPERVVERQQRSAHEGERIQHRDRWMRQERQDGERHGLRHLEALGHQQHATLVRAVRHRAGPRREHDQRSELARRERTDGKAAVRKLQHEQDEHDVRELVARVGDELADEEQPEVVGRERLEGVAQRGPRSTAYGGRNGW